MEFALGLFKPFFVEVAAATLVEVLQCCNGLSPEETAIVVDDFEFARAHLLEVLTLKLQNWSVLPWRLAALGDWDSSRLQQTAQAILQEFQECDDASKHHRITLHFLAPDSQLRKDIEALAAGQDIAMLPVLRLEMGKIIGWMGITVMGR